MNESIKEKRIKKGISMRQLSSKTGVAVSTIYRIEKGLCKPNRSTATILEHELEEAKCQTTENTRKTPE